jgi:hypothetical protein
MTTLKRERDGEKRKESAQTPQLDVGIEGIEAMRPFLCGHATECRSYDSFLATPAAAVGEADAATPV